MSSITNTIKNYAQQHAPEILTGVACAGVGVTAILASKATIEAHEIVSKNDIYATKFTEKDADGKKEQVKHFTKYVLPNYIPTFLIGSATVACMLAAHNIDARRIGAMATICASSTKALEDYKGIVANKIGGKKLGEIAQDVVQKKIDEHPIDEEDKPKLPCNVDEGQPASLWYDETTDRYFYSSMEKMRRVEADLKNQLLDDDIVRLNDIYDAIGLPEVKLGDDLGFDITRGDQVRFVYNTAMSPDDEPMCTVSFPVTPLWTFYDTNDRRL